MSHARLVALLGRAGTSRITPSKSSRISRGLRRGLRARLAALAVGLGLSLLGGTALHAGYKIENVSYPAEIKGGLSSVVFSPNGSLVIATRLGEIWIRDAKTSAWRRFARGLDEPTGIVIESERVIYISHRPELLRATDSDGDGRADTFEALGAKWGLAQNYHEFFFGLKRDRAGNFYGSPSLDSTVTRDAAHKKEYATLPVRGTRNLDHVLEPTGHMSELPWRGWMVRIGPDGKFEPFASGFRQTNGIALSPDGDLFVTDNQGDYKPSTGLLHVEKGDFHGHAGSLKWDPAYDAAALTTEKLWQRVKTPAIVFPHGPMGNSPGEPVWDQSRGKFGPYAGQVFVGDYSRLMIRASLERVGGAWQGACFPFLGRNELPTYVTGDRYKAGATRATFAPDGSLYLSATAGWGAGEDGLQRITWDGKLSPDIRDIKLTDRGFALTFTKPIDRAQLAKPESYDLTRFRYYYHAKYGSPWVDEARVSIKEIHAAADGLSAELVLAELKPGFIYEVSVPTLRTTDGESLANPLAYYTANRLRNGERTVGGTTRLPLPGETSLGAKEAPGETANAPTAAQIAAGEKIYRLYCVACHQPDGRGLPVPGGAANFVDDKSRLAKSDA
ncbi:MAG: hypothetical protein V4773_02835, partial [Verrucomicrobiota bacterium]